METTETIDQLAPSPTNPRVITDDAMAGLSQSLTTFGDVGIITWNQRSGHLVAGHQRVRALIDAGAKSWTRDGTGGWIEHPKTGQRFAVRVVDWDEQTERAANLSANSESIQGDFTAEALDQLIGLQDTMPAKGFEDLMLDTLMETLAVEQEKFKDAMDGDDDDAPKDEEPKLVKCPKCGEQFPAT